jgi:hypothetical protein
MKITRDSLVLSLGILAAVITYLINAKPVYEWLYNDWLMAASFLVATALGKLSTSPLAGEKK